jgi:hypothetical protein
MRALPHLSLAASTAAIAAVSDDPVWALRGDAEATHLQAIAQCRRRRWVLRCPTPC